MKIINLKLQAFGPYKDEVNIDFSKFGNKGIYLISGKTGSGKTSIFDAISYALFGKSSSGDKSENLLRFVNSSYEEETFVELTFEYRNKVYTVKRTPTYERKKKKGIGTTTKGTNKASIVLPDGQKLLEINQVDEYIRNLLNIDKTQFNQIAMLAQGDFSKFLKASSDEKKELFREIFSTQKYSQLEQKISEKCLDLKNKLETVLRDIDINWKNLKCEEKDRENFENVSIHNEYLDFIKSVNVEFTKQIKLQSIEKNQKEIIIKKLENLKNKVEEYNENKKKIECLENSFSLIKTRFEQSKLEYEKLDEIKLKKLDLENQKRNLEEIIKKEKKILELRKLRTEKVNKLKNSNIKLSELCIEINDKKHKIKSLEDFIEENQKIDLDIEKKENIQKYLNQIDNIDKDILRNKSILKSKHDEYKILKDKYICKDNEYREYRDRFFELQAGILAENLKENDPCPVCGSLNHPNPAKLGSKKYSKEKLDKLEKNREDIESQKKDLLTNIKEYNTIIKEKEKNKEQILNDLNISDKYLKSDNFIKNSRLRIQEELKNLFNIKDKLENYLENLEKEKKFLNKLENQRIEKDKEISLFEKDIENLENQEKDLNIQFNIDEFNKRSDEFTKMEQEILNLNSVISNTEEDYYSNSREFTKIKTELETYKNLQREEYNQDLTSILKELRENENDKKTIESKINNLEHYLKTNQNILEDMKKYINQYKILKEKYENYTDLANVIKGKIQDSKENLKFETYIQLKYFSEIIEESNKRFYEMTDRKLSLRRKRDADSKKGQFGLDLDVYDHHNGVIRSIKTLSGGESFQASLSLALGLSDIIQKKSGGIQINSLFVDEGFGTLDKETLSKVMSTLIKLSNQNKLIGLISHVDELKEQIDKQIVVEKTQYGNSVVKKQIF